MPKHREVASSALEASAAASVAREARRLAAAVIGAHASSGRPPRPPASAALAQPAAVAARGARKEVPASPSSAADGSKLDLSQAVAMGQQALRGLGAVATKSSSSSPLSVASGGCSAAAAASPLRTAVRFAPSPRPRLVDEEEGEPEDVPDGDVRPSFFIERTREPPPGALVLSHKLQHTVPDVFARYLRSYQRTGIKWVYERLRDYGGALLCDDMGLGKTAQSIAICAALLRKTGRRDADLSANITRHRKASVPWTPSIKDAAPILVIVPASVCANWRAEFEQWGYFDVVNLQDTPPGKKLEVVREYTYGRKEVLIVTHACATHATTGPNSVFDDLQHTHWGLIIVDEIHEFRNATKSRFEALKGYTSERWLGLTGTPIQNGLRELWSLLSIIYRERVGDQHTFEKEYADPIKKSMGNNRSASAEEAGRVASEAFRRDVWNKFVLQRFKSTVLADDLPKKEEIVLFCKLTPLQEAVYQRILVSKDCVLALENALKAQVRKERNERKRPRGEVVEEDDDEVGGGGGGGGGADGGDGDDEHGPLWRGLHLDGRECDKCASGRCMILPCMQKLRAVSNHLELVKNGDAPGRSAAKAEADRAFTLSTLDAAQMRKVGGPEPCNRLDILGSAELSGKLAVLQRIVDRELKAKSKILIFSRSVRLLHILDFFLRANFSCRHEVFSGELSAKQRTDVVNKFNSNPSVEVLLISLKAGGVGLNLTAANVVIIFDPDWNPANDQQAQDRAYRIGQTRKVKVYRLISLGTIEELAYLRQIDKSSLAQKAAHDVAAPKLFDRGDIRGIAAVFQYRPGGFTKRLLKRYRKQMESEDPWIEMEEKEFYPEPPSSEAISVDPLAILARAGAEGEEGAGGASVHTRDSDRDRGGGGSGKRSRRAARGGGEDEGSGTDSASASRGATGGGGGEEDADLIDFAEELSGEVVVSPLAHPPHRGGSRSGGVGARGRCDSGSTYSSLDEDGSTSSRGMATDMLPQGATLADNLEFEGAGVAGVISHKQFLTHSMYEEKRGQAARNASYISGAQRAASNVLGVAFAQQHLTNAGAGLAGIGQSSSSSSSATLLRAVSGVGVSSSSGSSGMWAGVRMGDGVGVGSGATPSLGSSATSSSRHAPFSEVPPRAPVAPAPSTIVASGDVGPTSPTDYFTKTEAVKAVKPDLLALRKLLAEERTRATAAESARLEPPAPTLHPSSMYDKGGYCRSSSGQQPIHTTPLAAWSAAPLAPTAGAAAVDGGGNGVGGGGGGTASSSSSCNRGSLDAFRHLGADDIE